MGYCSATRAYMLIREGVQQFTKKVLTIDGNLPRCDTQVKTEPCVDLSQCTLVPNWENIDKDIVYPNSDEL